MISASADRNIGIWDPYNFVGSIKNAHDGAVTCLKSFGPGIPFFVSGGQDNLIKIWETDSFKLVRRLVGHSATVSTFEILSNGLLASGSHDGTIMIWNVNSAEILRSFGFENKISKIFQLANGKLAFSMVSNQKLIVLDIDSSDYDYFQVNGESSGDIYGFIRFNSDALFALSLDHTVYFYDSNSVEIKSKFSTEFYPLCLEKQPIGKYFI